MVRCSVQRRFKKAQADDLGPVCLCDVCVLCLWLCVHVYVCVNNSFDTVFYHLRNVCVCLFVCLCVRVCMFVCLWEREIVLLRDQTMCTCNNNITQRKRTHSHMCSSLTATYIRFLQFTRQTTVYRSDRSLLWPLKVACSLPSGSPTQCICKMQSSENVLLNILQKTVDFCIVSSKKNKNIGLECSKFADDSLAIFFFWCQEASIEIETMNIKPTLWHVQLKCYRKHKIDDQWAHGGEGASASCRAPQGRDQTPGEFDMIFVGIVAAATPKKKVENWATCGSSNSEKISKISRKTSSCGSRNSKKTEKLLKRKRIKLSMIILHKRLAADATRKLLIQNESNWMMIEKSYILRLEQHTDTIYMWYVIYIVCACCDGGYACLYCEWCTCVWYVIISYTYMLWCGRCVCAW